MNNSPLASLVVLTYNQEKSIGRTLESLVRQKTSFPYEIIVCDDCSTDGTSQIVLDYASKYSQIVPIINEVNLGLVKNHAKALSLCRGKYRAGCAGDDFWIDDYKLQKQVDILETHPDVCLVYTDAVVNSIGTGQQFVRKCPDPQEDVYNQLLSNTFLTAPTICYRMSMYTSIDLHDILEQHFIMEDYPLLLELAYRYKFYHLKDATVNYQVDRITNDNIEQALLDSCKFAAETLKVQKYFINKYPDRTIMTEHQAEDNYFKICYKDMLFLKRRKEALKYMKKVNNKTLYINLMIVLLHLPFGADIYDWYYRKKHPNTSALSVYFGGEACE